jgi:hypothetical protein
VHQNNYQTILALRAKSDALDSQIKTTLQTLAGLRKELIAAKLATSSKKNARPVDYEQLLSYARQIAPFSRPPHIRQTMPPPIESKLNGIANSEVKKEASETPADSAIHSPLQQLPTSHLTLTKEDSRLVAALPEDIKAWLEPSKFGVIFMPWPDNDVIRRGALSRIQGVREQGDDPESMDIPAAIEAQRREIEDGGELQDQKLEEDQKEVDARIREAGNILRPQPAAPVNGEGGGGGFGFDLYDPED